MTRTDARACHAVIPDPSRPGHLTYANPRHLQDADAPRLLTYLACVPDPRAARGRRHPLAAILGLAAAAVLAGATSIAAIAEWAADTPNKCGPRSAPATTPPATSPSPPRPPSAGPWRAWTPTPWPLLLGLAGRPGGCRTRSQPAAGRRRRRPGRPPPGWCAGSRRPWRCLAAGPGLLESRTVAAAPLAGSVNIR
jgi:hypothetical protein